MFAGNFVQGPNFVPLLLGLDPAYFTLLDVYLFILKPLKKSIFDVIIY